MKYALLQTVEAGASLIPVVKHLNQDKIDMFGVLSGATGSVHVDPVYCANSPFKTTLAHGFLTMAYASEMMELNFGMDWATSGEIEVKFIGQAHPGDTVLTEGRVTKVEEREDGLYVECALTVLNQVGGNVMVGTASLIKKK
ncbi:MaoC family dehydratase [Intestinimonas butyriciproducens]|uniref:MaoC family dehydratase n=1 Tax=Intestinimonas butyriciproducens TaxID=1297617 RepID=UPI00189954B3|nr:MaoC family dehydratase [Intestinimonas butyriciproducens]MDB7831877.1 MaoC family dehydratase [Intestinimonas butyriciproducens]